MGGDDEPDYRFTLANERTFLAWVRTGLALDAAGLGVLHFAPDLAISGAHEVIGVALIALGGVVTVAGYRRWALYQDALRRDEPLPQTRLPLLLAVALTALAGLTTVLLLLAR